MEHKVIISTVVLRCPRSFSPWCSRDILLFLNKNEHDEGFEPKYDKGDRGIWRPPCWLCMRADSRWHRAVQDAPCDTTLHGRESRGLHILVREIVREAGRELIEVSHSLQDRVSCIISLFTSRSGYYIFARLSFCSFFTFKFEIMHAGLQFIILSVAEGYGGERCINAASCAEDCREVLCLSSVSSHIYGSSSCSGTGTGTLMIDLNALPLSVYCSRRSSLFFCTCLHKLMWETETDLHIWFDQRAQ